MNKKCPVIGESVHFIYDERDIDIWLNSYIKYPSKLYAFYMYLLSGNENIDNKIPHYGKWFNNMKDASDAVRDWRSTLVKFLNDGRYWAFRTVYWKG